jgi:hypothetical protein
MWVLFDDCVFAAGKKEPYLGKQGDTEPGVSLWTASPGHKAVTDRTVWPDLEKYVKTIASRYKDDKRVLIWNVYNKPGPYLDSTTSFPLARATLAWIRQVNPTQPVTVSVWENREALHHTNQQLLTTQYPLLTDEFFDEQKSREI